MATRRLDEGLLGWLLTGAALAGGLCLCGVGAYLGRTVRTINDARVDF